MTPWQVVDMEVQEERKYAIEAAIVRTMKMNRTMKLQLVRPTHPCLLLTRCDRATPAPLPN